VNWGGKTEGLIPAQEFARIGWPIPAAAWTNRSRCSELAIARMGTCCLSYQRVRRRRAWGRIEEAYRNKTDITGKVVDHNQGRTCGGHWRTRVFAGIASDTHPVRDLVEWKDRELAVRVLKMNRKRGNVVVSRRAILDGGRCKHSGRPCWTRWPRDRPCAA